MTGSLRDCVEELRGRLKQIVQLHYLGEKSIQDVAAKPGVSTNSVFVALHRAREALRMCMERKHSDRGGSMPDSKILISRHLSGTSTTTEQAELAHWITAIQANTRNFVLQSFVDRSLRKIVTADAKVAGHS